MTIEFQTPYGKVPEQLLNFARQELLKMAHIQKKISRAEVILLEDGTLKPGHDKVCEINLSIIGADLFARNASESFEQSLKAALKDLKRLVKSQVKQLAQS
jgi:ribosome-associated translation inhibitor RaiA